MSTYPHEREPVASVREIYDAHLHPDRAVQTFRNTHRLFSHAIVTPAARPRPLPPAPSPLVGLSFRSRGRSWDLDDYLAVNRVAGLLVLKAGTIALETYQYGNTPQTRWMSMSVAKSVTSTLVGAALHEGLLGSLDDPVTRYVPALRTSAYQGVTMRHIITMRSGVRWNETYTDPASDRRRLLEAQLTGRPGGMLGLLASLPRASTPGSTYCYSTGDTQVAAEVLRQATGSTLASYLSTRIWQPCGAEASATWWLEGPGGVEIGGSGLAATLRDYGRFGLFCADNGLVGDRQLLPKGWMRQASSPHPHSDATQPPYGYFWWPARPTDAYPTTHGAYAAEGIFGQHLYINPRHQVVIVIWGARSKPNGLDIIDDQDFCAAATQAVSLNGAPRG
jgi:CubicO group peptidase (beta-lactamase class C family)